MSHGAAALMAAWLWGLARRVGRGLRRYGRSRAAALRAGDARRGAAHPLWWR